MRPPDGSISRRFALSSFDEVKRPLSPRERLGQWLESRHVEVAIVALTVVYCCVVVVLLLLPCDCDPAYENFIGFAEFLMIADVIILFIFQIKAVIDINPI